MLRSTKFNIYLNCMRKYGFSGSDVLEGIHLSEEQLLDPNCVIDTWQAKTIISNMIRLSGNTGIAFQIARDMEISDLGIVGYAILSSRTCRDAINIWLNYSRFLVGMLVEMEVEEQADSWQIILPKEVDDDSLVFCSEELLLFNLFLGGKLVGKPLQNIKLELSYSPPQHAHLYKQAFKCPVTFNAKKTCLTVKEPGLDDPVRTNNAELFLLCKKHCDQVLNDVDNDDALVTRIRSKLFENPGAIPTLEEMADMLCFSPRTLKRRLQEQSISYKTLVNIFRNDIVKEYLKNSHMSTKEIAYYLGYSDASSLRRAFKVANGITINQFRENSVGTVC